MTVSDCLITSVELIKVETHPGLSNEESFFSLERGAAVMCVDDDDHLLLAVEPLGWKWE